MKPSLPIVADAHASTIRALVAIWQRLQPELASRVAHAASLVLLADIQPVPGELGVWLVQSERDPAVYYRVTQRLAQQARGCTCVDFTGGKAPRGWCKHQLALLLAFAAADREREMLEGLMAHREARAGEEAAA